jgi:hypothetical protein
MGRSIKASAFNASHQRLREVKQRADLMHVGPKQGFEKSKVRTWPLDDGLFNITAKAVVTQCVIRFCKSVPSASHTFIPSSYLGPVDALHSTIISRSITLRKTEIENETVALKLSGHS